MMEHELKRLLRDADIQSKASGRFGLIIDFLSSQFRIDTNEITVTFVSEPKQLTARFGSLNQRTIGLMLFLNHRMIEQCIDRIKQRFSGLSKLKALALIDIGNDHLVHTIIGIRDHILVDRFIKNFPNANVEWIETDKPSTPHPLSRECCKPKDGAHFTVAGASYTLRGKLGDGAIGLVRKAERQDDNAPFAIKFLAPDPKYINSSAFPDVLRRFRREGERGKHLRHPALVRIDHFIENSNGSAFRDKQPTNPFILMERLGTTLERHIRSRQNPLEAMLYFQIDETKIEIALQIAHGIKHLHELDIKHRDIKPANIFFAQNSPHGKIQAKIGDFGVVKWADYQAALTQGTLTATSTKGLGTIKYQAPELETNPKSAVEQSDIYSLGITLYELFTGCIIGGIQQVINVSIGYSYNHAERAQKLGLEVASADENLFHFVLKMVSRDQSERPTSAEVCKQLLQRYEMEFGIWHKRE